jgi:hypothetical protein
MAEYSTIWAGSGVPNKYRVSVGTMKALSVALLTSMIILVGCAGPVELLFQNPIVVDHLDGNY